MRKDGVQSSKISAVQNLLKSIRRCNPQYGAVVLTSVVDLLTVVTRDSSPAILREQLDALVHVEFGNEDCIKADIHKSCVWNWGRVGHPSSLVMLPHIVQAYLGVWLGIQAAASSAVDPNVSIAL